MKSASISDKSRFVGSKVFFNLEGVVLCRKDLRAKSAGIRPDIFFKNESLPNNHYLRNIAIIQGSKAWRSIADVLNLIPIRERRTIISRINQFANPISSDSNTLLNRFFSQENRTVTNRELENFRLNQRISDFLNSTPKQKKIKKIKQMIQLANLNSKSATTLRSSAATLGISLNRVKYLFKIMKKGGRFDLFKEYSELLQTTNRQTTLEDFFKKNESNESFMNSTIPQIRQKFIEENIHFTPISVADLSKAFHDFGFRFASIHYFPKIARPLSNLHKEIFFELYAHIVLNRDNLRVVFFDESSITLGNFKKKRWMKKNMPTSVHGSVKHIGITLLGAIDSSEVIALQFVRSSINSNVILSFFEQLFHRLTNDINDKRTIVLFLDNCPSHHSVSVKDLAKKAGVILLYNMPHTSQINPIEYFWEYLKRPFRSLVNHFGLNKKNVRLGKHYHGKSRKNRRLHC